MIRRTTWIVLIVFVLVLAAALIWQRSSEQRAAQATPTATPSLFIDMEGRQVTGVQISGATGKKLAIEKGLDGSWVVVEPAGGLADQARIEQLVSDLGALQVSAKLDDIPALANLGLSPADYRIAVKFEDGSTTIVYFGDKTPTQDGYYAYREGDQVVVVDIFGVDSLIEYLNSPPVQSTPASIIAPGVTGTP